MSSSARRRLPADARRARHGRRRRTPAHAGCRRQHRVHVLRDVEDAERLRDALSARRPPAGGRGRADRCRGRLDRRRARDAVTMVDPVDPPLAARCGHRGGPLAARLPRGARHRPAPRAVVARLVASPEADRGAPRRRLDPGRGRRGAAGCRHGATRRARQRRPGSTSIEGCWSTTASAPLTRASSRSATPRGSGTRRVSRCPAPSTGRRPSRRGRPARGPPDGSGAAGRASTVVLERSARSSRRGGRRAGRRGPSSGATRRSVRSRRSRSSALEGDRLLAAAAVDDPKVVRAAQRMIDRSIRVDPAALADVSTDPRQLVRPAAGVPAHGTTRGAPRSGKV